MNFKIKSNNEKLPAVVVVPLVQNAEGKANLSIVQTVLTDLPDSLADDFGAGVGEVLVWYHQRQKLLLLGLGKTPKMREVIKAFRQLGSKHQGKLTTQFAVDFSYLPTCNFELLDATVNGLELSSYDPGTYKSDKKGTNETEPTESTVVLALPHDMKQNDAEAAIQRGRVIAEAQREIMELVNAPANKKLPERLGDWASQTGKMYGLKVKVMKKREIEKTGLHALLAVNRGSESPPVFIIMDHQPKDLPADALTIALVGKGVTFDTGGVSIKGSANMHYMKSDMGGAAAVLGTLRSAARLKLPIRLIGVVPATDNSVDATAIKPSDVIDSYSGKTIEIIDTDAEGRLILADGLAYVNEKYSPDYLINLATLTGSTVRALGYHAAALFTDNDELAKQLRTAGDDTGERVWQLPLWDEYKTDLESDVADIRNFSGKPVAGAINAATFLQFFTSEHPAWAHLDIAGVAFGDTGFTKMKSATGFGVRLLVHWLENLTQ